MKRILRYLLAAPLLLAHHSIWVTYDANQPITIQGTIARCEFARGALIAAYPVCFVDAKDANGQPVQWELELGHGGINPPLRQGTLKTGESVTVSAFRAKKVENRAAAWRFTLADGRQIMTADGWGWCVSGGNAEPRIFRGGDGEPRLDCPKR